MKSSTATCKFAAAFAVVSLPLALSSTGYADVATLPGCGENNSACSWTIQVDGRKVGEGTYTVDSQGNVSFPGQTIDLGDGSSVGVKSLSGNVDPLLGFSTSASTAALGKSFTFVFSLPIALSGKVDAASSIGYTLTAKTTAGAEIKPFLQSKVLVAADVDTSVGGAPDLDKHVDAGDTFSIQPFTGPPNFKVEQSQTYSAANAFMVGPAYDLMSVRVSFSLSANSEVGISGAVEQATPIPEVSTYAMLVAGLFGVGFALRRRLGSSDSF